MSRPGLIARPLHSTPLQINSQSIPRLDPIDSKSSYDIKMKTNDLLKYRECHYYKEHKAGNPSFINDNQTLKANRDEY